MNDKAAITARHLWKGYAISERSAQARKTRDIWRALLRRRTGAQQDSVDMIWPTQDVSLSVMPGQALGIIGRNGAGKTTLMKLLAGIIQPDRGDLTTRGNVQAMINLSAGMVTDLSAVANIRNAAAVRGMSGKKLADNIGRILDFAELTDRADSLVGTFSSGMRARLGFAISVHMEPDVVIIDEALSVGDMLFRQKCLRRLNEMRSDGVAMVLVSHSLGQIRQFCDEAIWIEAGAIRESGETLGVVRKYTAFIEKLESGRTRPIALHDATTSDGGEQFQVRDPVHREDAVGAVLPEHTTLVVHSLDDLTISVNVRLLVDVANLNVGMRIVNQDGRDSAAISSFDIRPNFQQTAGNIRLEGRIKNIPLVPGHYWVILSVNDAREKLYRSAICSLEVREGRRSAWNASMVLDATLGISNHDA